MIWLVKLFGLLSGPIVGSLADAYKARQEAKTDETRVAADERVKTIEAQARVHGTLESVMRMAVAIPFIVYLWKVIIYDKVLELGTTDNLSQNLWNIFYIILAFYFLHQAVSRLAR